ncbi:MAG: hypothetical protein KIS65_05600 [Nitrosomonas sp.]|nr:hypothetical protein [Nitrosomonas sp.]
MQKQNIEILNILRHDSQKTVSHFEIIDTFKAMFQDPSLLMTPMDGALICHELNTT